VNISKITVIYVKFRENELNFSKNELNIRFFIEITQKIDFFKKIREIWKKIVKS
jgi:predicted proteasome-type protease